MPEIGPPSGTVTFLFTDIEGSTKLWETFPVAMRRALARHDELMHGAISEANGVVFKTIGDAFCAAFAVATDAIEAALNAQMALKDERWPEGLQIKVRMSIHTGAVESRDGDYFGPPLNRVARLLGICGGGQTLISEITRDLSQDMLPADVTLVSLGDHHLRDMARTETVFQLNHPHLAADFPAIRSRNNQPTNLPTQVTSFIGRETEMAETREQLERVRILTLTGPGGSGKTRLALEIASEVRAAYPDGVWLIELAQLSDAVMLPQAVATVFGLPESKGKSSTSAVAEHLRDKTVLLLLDNCEHVLDGAAPFADEIIRQCHQVKILATSREALFVAGEQVYRVPSLSLPDPSENQTAETLGHYEAVRLFVDRAILARPDFHVTNENAPAVASICFRLDGIPLAIELAAARTRSLPAEAINAKLDQRFRLLTGGSRTALPRQQTLRSLIDWSYELLNDTEKTLLRRVAVFAGGWTLTAAEQVCIGDPVEEWEMLDLMTSLLDKSLILYEERGAVGRFRMLETIREYALERLAESGEERAVRLLHRDHFRGRTPHADVKTQSDYFEDLSREHENIRGALAFCAAGDQEDVDYGLEFAASMQWFWGVSGRGREGQRWLKIFLDGGQGGQTPARAAALAGNGELARMAGNDELAKACLTEALQIFETLGRPGQQSFVLNNLGWLAMLAGDLDEADRLHDQARVIAGEEDPGMRAFSESRGGVVAALKGDVERSRKLQDSALQTWRTIGYASGIAHGLCCRAVLARVERDHVTAREVLDEAVQICRQVGDRRLLTLAFRELAYLAASLDELERCAILHAQAEQLGVVIGFPIHPSQVPAQEADLLKVAAGLGEDATAAAWSRGLRMSLPEALDYALSHE